MGRAPLGGCQTCQYWETGPEAEVRFSDSLALSSFTSSLAVDCGYCRYTDTLRWAAAHMPCWHSRPAPVDK